MPELGSHGSGLGARGNSGPYRESRRGPVEPTRMTQLGHCSRFHGRMLVPAQATVSFVGLSNIRVRVSVLEVHIVFGKSSALVSNQAGRILVAA